MAERFHLIDSPVLTAYLPWGDGSDLLQNLWAGSRGRTLFRHLGQYGVSIYEQHFAALEMAGDIEVLENNVAILRNSSLYSEQTGLSLEADNVKGLFI